MPQFPQVASLNKCCKDLKVKEQEKGRKRQWGAVTNSTQRGLLSFLVGLHLLAGRSRRQKSS